MIIRDNFSYFSMKPYDVTPHLNRLIATVQMRSHNITRIAKNYPLSSKTPSYLELCIPSTIGLKFCLSWSSGLQCSQLVMSLVESLVVIS